MCTLIFVFFLSLLGILGKAENGLRIPCVNKTNCEAFCPIGTAICERGFCFDQDKSQYCIEDDLALINNKSVPLVTRTCSEDLHCTVGLINTSFCNITMKQCACLKNYIPSEDQKHCLEVVKSYNSSCNESQQCTEFMANTTCYYSMCMCIKGHHYAHDKCRKSVAFGYPCVEDEDCSHIEKGTCATSNSSKLCGCSTKDVINLESDMCIPIANDINDSCSYDPQCSHAFNEAICGDNKTCQCQKDYHYEKEPKECVATRGIGEPCKNDKECYLNEPFNETRLSHCSKGEDGNEKTNNTCVMNGANGEISITVQTIFIVFISYILASL